MIEGLREWNEYVRLLVGLLALINPLTILPIFLTMVHGRSGVEKAHVSTVAALTVLVTLLIFTYLGAALLDLFAITIESFRIAGGILLLLTALEMMRAKSPTG
ncbi:MAG TPA: MarC family protein, partial [Alphaproteobacteria bacterium]|nr:MarC family protein [Alphaproteobacteria bacterium]